MKANSKLIENSMRFYELEKTDISNLNDGDLRELVARLCEAELAQQGVGPVCVLWGEHRKQQMVAWMFM